MWRWYGIARAIVVFGIDCRWAQAYEISKRFAKETPMGIACRRPRFGLFTSILSVLFVISSALLAQTTGQIRGTVTDPSGAGLPGATVEVSSPSLQGTRTTVTGAGGAFQVPALPPGSYKVVVSLEGFAKAEQQTQVRLDATASLALSLRVTTTAEVVVTGEAPVVDVSSTTGGSNYTAAVIDRLPVGRNYTDIVRSNPGVTEDRADR
jgi:hypothetical protein